jgi:hypothetical protein
MPFLTSLDLSDPFGFRSTSPLPPRQRRKSATAGSTSAQTTPAAR